MDSLNPDQPEQPEISLCRSCGINPAVGDHPNPLCETCRQKFIRFPIPVWVKAFGAGVLILVLIGLFSFPKQVATGIHMKRAENAMDEKKYLTAERELKKVLSSAPEMKDAKLDLLIASYFTLDMRTLVEMSNGLKGVSFENNPHFTEAQDLTVDAQNLFPSDSLIALMQGITDTTKTQGLLKSYVEKHPGESYAICAYASSYSAKENHAWCDSMIHKILQADPNNIKAIMTATYLAREQHQYDSALNYCQQLLNRNAECSFAIAAQARIHMAQGQVTKGIELARKACALDSTDGYSEATLALGYHLNNQPAERDKLIASKASDSVISSYMDYVREVMENKTKFN